MSLSPQLIVRIEPSIRTTDIAEGLAAKVADPLWMLLRQWQLGELKGDDGGSPIAVDIQTSWSPFTRFRTEAEGPTMDESGPVEAVAQSVPLEAMVEGEYLLDEDTAGWSTRVQTGRALTRILTIAGLDDVAGRLTTAFPFEAVGPADGDLHANDLRYRRVFADAGTNLLDGVRVLHAAALPAEVIDGVDAATLDIALTAWREELTQDWGPLRRTAGPSASWVRDRLEYAFSIAAPPLPGEVEEHVFTAREYDGRGLAWHSVDIHPGETLSAVDDPGAGSHIWTTLPTRLTYPGMPADRFWEFEDAAVQLGRVSAGTTDLARMMVIDFAEIFSPDWFLVPVDVPVGSVSRVDWIIVRDTFGAATLVGTSTTQATDQVGRQFQPSTLNTVPGGEGDHPMLVVLPAAMGALEGPAIEEVALQRDEAANLAWAIEKWVTGQTGRGIPNPWLRSEFGLEEAKATDCDVVWRLSTPVAKSWTPLVTSKDSENQVLRKAELLATDTGKLRSASGRIMADVDRDIRDEEITRAGIRVRMTTQLTRSPTGSTHVWQGREKRIWKGEVASGLRYDATTTP